MKYQIDPSHSSASFSIKHMMIAKVHGAFDRLKGELTFDPKTPSQSQISVEIEAASINTGEPKRDEHLRSADFFDVSQFPLLTFKSTSIEVVGSSEGLKVIGDLTIHGVTKAITLEVEGPSAELKDPWGNLRIGASAKTKIKRKDFGLTWNSALEAGGFLVGDDVQIELDVQFVKQS